ncbi:transmembrane protein 182-like isoform X2 [Corapipo altera]|uniref:transmembrane protein 182-like isoform X2 n=1 Tax=Corapipo altera TaxID=415028 RepID=UPI000FD682BC|nr:transmembrane protein 182-like isoform X2 [Corapipo altera]
MKAGIAALAAGILGGTGVLLFLVAFGTDYWLLATETCGVFEHENSTLSTGEAETPTETRKEILTFHHEGFFWRCWFFGEGHPESIWTFWYTSQAHPKFCMHGYLFPMPIALGPFPHPSYDTTAVYRGFWTAFILLAVAAALVGGLLLVCGIPFVSPRSYKVGGGFLLLSAKELDFGVHKLPGRIMKYATTTFDLKMARGEIKSCRSHNTSTELCGNLSTELILSCSLLPQKYYKL